MQTAVARPGTGVPPRGQGLNGRCAVALLATVVVVFMAAAVGFAFSQRWRQSERLVAPGLRHPRGVAVVGPDLLAVAEAGPPGRLSWISTGESARGTVIEGLPSEELVGGGQAGPVDVGVAPDGQLLILEQGQGAHDGRLLRIDPARPEDRRVVSAALDRPAALAVATDGRAYVSLDGGDGAGELIQIRRLGPQPTPRSI